MNELKANGIPIGSSITLCATTPVLIMMGHLPLGTNTISANITNHPRCSKLTFRIYEKSGYAFHSN